MRSFHSCSTQDCGLLGFKALSLCRLTSLGCTVPPGFIFETTYLNDFFEQAGSLGRIRWLQEHGPRLKEEYVQELGQEIIECLRSSDWPSRFQEDLKACFNKLGGGKVPLICRSSSTMEDSQEAAFPGVFLTVPNITNWKKLEEAVLECCCSLFQPRALGYWLRRSSLPLPWFTMGLIIQHDIETAFAGVMFYQDEHTVQVEVVVGQGSGLMAGKVQPTLFWKDPQHPSWEIIGPKGNLNSGEPLLAPDQLLELERIGHLTKETWGTPVDIEFGFCHGQQIPFIFQCRPITTRFPPLHPRKSITNKTSTYEPGVICSPGIVEGLGLAPGSDSELRRPTNDSILLLEKLTEDHYELIFQVRGIVTEQPGSMLNHLSIACRELGIPYVSGIDQARRRFQGKEIVIDGYQGFVCLKKDYFPQKAKSDTVQASKSSEKELWYLPHLASDEKIEIENQRVVFKGSFYFLLEGLLKTDKKEDLLDHLTERLYTALEKRKDCGCFNWEVPLISEKELPILRQTSHGNWLSQESVKQVFEVVSTRVSQRCQIPIVIEENG